MTPDGGSTTDVDYTVNNSYQITDVDATSWTWDDNGQLLEDDQGWDFTWTALGQLASAEQHTSLPDQDHTYDAFGRRVETTDGTDTWEYLYHGWHMIGEYEATDADWLWMEVPMAWGEGMLEHIAWDSSASDYKQHAVHEDFQSTVWALSNSAGTVVERYVQDDPYGVTHTLDASSSNLGDYATEVYHRKRLHGGVVDAVVGIYDFRNRWLRPEEGTWMSRDGLGSIDSGNLQQFATHAPTSLTDYYGLTVISSSLGQCYSLTLGQSCTAPLLVQQLCSMTSSGASLRGVDQTVKDYMKTLCKLRITCRCLGCATPVLGSDLEVPVNAFIDPVDPMRVFVNYWRTDRPEEILHPLFPEPNSGMPGVPRRGLIDCCPCAAAEPGGSLLRTLLHEGLHSHCHESGGTDCGHGGEWHNSDGAYDDAAEDLIECIGGNSSDACKRAAGFIHDDPLM